MEKNDIFSCEEIADNRGGAVRLRKLMATALQQKDCTLALELAAVAEKLDVHCKSLHYLRGLIYLMLKRPHDAQRALEKELVFFPDCEPSKDLLREVKDQLAAWAACTPTDIRSVVAENASLKGKHQGERCFIVCNAPSIQNYDLELLKNDVVFSVSNGYLHEKYNIFKPQYHCVPQITYTERFTKDVARRWFVEMHENIGIAELFIATQEYELVRSCQLFAGRRVHYIDFCFDSSVTCIDKSDISSCIPGVWSVSIMCLYVAMYMGFDNIYILGADHDYIITGKYAHFYEKCCTTGLEYGVDIQNNHIGRTYTRLKGLYALFSQYEYVKEVAQFRGINVYNASMYGLLDTFPRVKYEDLF